MQSKPTLKDLRKNPRHRTYARGPALNVPTPVTRRTAQSKRCYLGTPTARTNIPARLKSKQLAPCGKFIARVQIGGRIPL